MVGVSDGDNHHGAHHAILCHGLLRATNTRWQSMRISVAMYTHAGMKPSCTWLRWCKEVSHTVTMGTGGQIKDCYVPGMCADTETASLYIWWRKGDCN